MEILPGSLLQTTRTTTGGGDPWLHPAEPSQPPPRPTEMVPFLLVGPRHSGKRAAFQTFSNGHKNRVADSPSVVEYCKKDVTIWVNDDTNVAACARVQLWNVTTDMGIPQQQQQEGRRQQEWMKLISKMTYILLVVSFEEGGPQATLHQISKWKRWLDESSTVVSLPTVHLILTKSDLLPTCVSPTFWINFGSQLERLCQRLGIRHFHMTTTTLSSSSCHTHDHYETPEEVILKLVRSTVTSRNTTRQGNLVSTTTKSKLKGNGSRV